MAFRFFRRVKLAPGVSLNLSKRGGSLSFGPRGAKMTVGTSGQRRTVGIPGTGMYWYETSGRRGGNRSGGGRGRREEAAASTPTVPLRDRLDLGFFQRLVTPQGEEDFVDGMRALIAGEERAARRKLGRATDLADAAFMAGVLALKAERLTDARAALESALARRRSLGRLFEKYGIEASVNLFITEQVGAVVTPCARGIRLALAEAHQKADRWRDALAELKKLYQADRDDPVVLLSLAELLIEQVGDQRAAKQVVRLAEGIDNVSPIHAALLLFKGRALRMLGLHTAARDALTDAFRRKKDRPDDLLKAIRYERALVYAKLGRGSRARSELEKLYAEDPDYEDVATRLGL